MWVNLNKNFNMRSWFSFMSLNCNDKEWCLSNYAVISSNLTQSKAIPRGKETLPIYDIMETSMKTSVWTINTNFPNYSSSKINRLVQFVEFLEIASNVLRNETPRYTTKQNSRYNILTSYFIDGRVFFRVFTFYIVFGALYLSRLSTRV